MTRIALCALFILAVGFAAFFHERQNRGTRLGTVMGGAISWPKAFWLSYALISWFLVPFAFLADPSLPAGARWALGAHLAIWWLRAPTELLMMHRWFNWSPVYGITHDLLHAALLGSFLTFSPEVRSAGLATAWIAVTFFTMLAEALFAFLFLRARGGMKNHLIYFASTEPRYRSINRLTLAVVIVVYAHMAWQSLLAQAAP